MATKGRMKAYSVLATDFSGADHHLCDVVAKSARAAVAEVKRDYKSRYRDFVAERIKLSEIDQDDLRDQMAAWMSRQEFVDDSIWEWDVGGNTVRMTIAQANSWNEADVTGQTMRGAQVYVPMIDRSGLEIGSFVSLWRYLQKNPDDVSFQEPANPKEYCGLMPTVPPLPAACMWSLKGSLASDHN
jgi:hypothetical protein